jgi:hypothetical protein
MTILRLFGPGAVTHDQVHVKYGSFTGLPGQLGCRVGDDGGHPGAPFTYKLGTQEATRLQDFSDQILSSLPENLYNNFQPVTDYMEMAFRRYSSVTQTEQNFEASVAGLASVLESLLLTGDEQELSYRLRLRTTVIMGILGWNPFKVLEVIKKGYKIRSSYVHGSFLSSKDRNKVEKEYTHLNVFLSILANYARATLLASLLTKGNVDKEELIGLIDMSMVDQTSRDELTKLLLPVRETLRQCLWFESPEIFNEESAY